MPHHVGSNSFLRGSLRIGLVLGKARILLLSLHCMNWLHNFFVEVNSQSNVFLR